MLTLMVKIAKYVKTLDLSIYPKLWAFLLLCFAYDLPLTTPYPDIALYPLP